MDTLDLPEQARQVSVAGGVTVESLEKAIRNIQHEAVLLEKSSDPVAVSETAKLDSESLRSEEASFVSCPSSPPRDPVIETVTIGTSNLSNSSAPTSMMVRETTESDCHQELQIEPGISSESATAPKTANFEADDTHLEGASFPSSVIMLPSAQSGTPPSSPKFTATETSSTDQCQITHCHTCSTIQSLSRIITSEHIQQFLDNLESVNTVRGPPPPPPPHGVQGDRASKLEFKTINEVWDEEMGIYTIKHSLAVRVNTLDEYVFVMRTRIVKVTKEPTFYIDIKSEELRDILREVLKDVYGINLTGDKPSFERQLLFHYFSELESYRSSLSPDTAAAKHLELLIDCLKKIYVPTTQRLLPLLEQGEITYDLLWALFKPNTMVYTTCLGTKKPRCVTYDSCEEKINRSNTRYLGIDCRFFDFNGTTFGDASIELAVPQFRGTRRIETLPAFPLKFHPDQKQVKLDLIECGRKFVSLIGTHHCLCQGEAFFMNKGDPVRLSVDSRIVIDADFFWKMNPNYSRPRADISKTSLGNRQRLPPGFILPPGFEQSQVKSTGIEPTDLKEDDFLVCCPTVLGFSLAEKLWAEFAVADIHDIEWQSSPYACLSIPDEQKDIIMALVEARIDPSVVFDDIVSGKGKGLIVLLHGPPGVGKTLTAEAVSEHLKRPLYSISVGELPLDAAELEHHLTRIFKTASNWGAMLLLDEADVFLERRSPDNLTRNALISVFLRKLEYYDGIMFLTTNRVSQFDEAILSRVHLMLRYDDLSIGARRQVWDSFLTRAATAFGEAEISARELEQLACNKLNGRQIKNIVSTAHAFATKEKTKIRIPHVKKAVKANERFFKEFYGIDYVNSTYT